jgi:dephospho-CoA kinase
MKALIGFTGSYGSGKRKVPQELARRYGYSYYSVRERIEKLFKRNRHRKAKNQNELTLFANNFRQKKGCESIIAPLLAKIFKSNGEGIYLIESFLCPFELEYFESECAKHGVEYKLIGLNAKIEDRLKRLQKRSEFKSVTIIEQLRTIEWRDECQLEPWQVNAEKCLEAVPEEGIFQNDNGQLSKTVEDINRYILR